MREAMRVDEEIHQDHLGWDPGARVQQNNETNNVCRTDVGGTRCGRGNRHRGIHK